MPGLPGSFSLVSVTLFKLGPTVTAVGRLGGGNGPVAQNQIAELSIPWHTLKADQKSVFSLLSWHTECSQFVGRDKELHLLADWAKADDPVSVKFVTGDGGVGKSRLGAHFARELQRDRWAAGFVDLRKDHAFPMHKAGTLLLVDYPEERVPEVRELLRDLTLCRPPSPLRALLLTRQSVDQWDEVVSGSKSDDIVDRNALRLGRLDDENATVVFNTTASKTLEYLVDAAGAEPGKALITAEALGEWIQQAPENQRALFIMAAAIRAAEDPDSEIVGYTGREVVQSLARREVARLQGVAVGRGMKDEFCLARLLAMAAIADELNLDDIRVIIADGKAPLGCKADDDLNGELTTAGLLDGGVVRAPKPDILAAAFVVDVLGRRPEFAPDAVWAALERDLSGGLERIGRLCWDAETVLGIHDNRLSVWLVKAVDGNWERADKVTDVLTEAELPQGLIKTSAVAWKTLAESASDEKSRALFLNNLSNMLDALGDTKGALQAIEEAVSIRRRLAADNPARFEPDLATSLNNLSTVLNAVGDTRGALKAIEEAVAIYRRLAADNPARFEPHLATSLNNLSGCLDAVGDTKAALEAVEEAVSIYRRLAADNPASLEPYLAASLNNLSNRLDAVGDTKAALVAIEETVSIRRRLAGDNHARFEPDLASSLNNLSDSLNAMGDTKAALVAINEAVSSYRRLAVDNPARFEPYLARSLCVLGDVWRNMDKRDRAVSAYKESLELLRPYADQWPGSRHEQLLRQTERDLKELEVS